MGGHRLPRKRLLVKAKDAGCAQQGQLQLVMRKTYRLSVLYYLQERRDKWASRLQSKGYR